MADVYLYVDETGNLDYETAGKEGASRYFGFGSVVFTGAHHAALWSGFELRVRLAAQGVDVQNGFHAINDSTQTRNEVFTELGWHVARIDATFLYKENAYESVKSRGQMGLYRMAWYLHFKEVALRVASKGDTLHVIAGTFGTRARAAEAKAALKDVCNQIDRSIVLCVWTAGSSWGLQLADYALWAIQRNLERGDCHWYESRVKPALKTEFYPWGRHPRRLKAQESRLSTKGSHPLDDFSPASTVDHISV